MTSLGDVLVLGLGASGLAAADYCARPGRARSVTAVDTGRSDALKIACDQLASLGVRTHLGGELPEGAWDLCVASPGIPPHAPMMRWARQHSAEVVSEIEFAYRQSECPWVAITGTNGKTTTTSLVAHLLNGGGVPARAVGNIGTPAIQAVTEATHHEVLVAEVSSFQLALVDTFHPRAAVLLNITPDHIDWHGSFDSYAADKARIFMNLTAEDVAVVDIDDAGSRPYAATVSDRGVPVVPVTLHATESRCATVRDGTMVLDTGGDAIRLVRTEELKIKGAHNVSNALAAAATAHALGVGVADLRWGLRSFEPIEHRLQPVGMADAVEWFNDSKATNPDAVMKAIAAFDDRPIVLLLGGRNKGNRFTELARAVAAGSARGVVAFGEARDQIVEGFDGLDVTVLCAGGLAEAVSVARDLAQPGDAVVLSPACASFDEFSNYEERGRAFTRLVSAIAEVNDG